MLNPVCCLIMYSCLQYQLVPDLPIETEYVFCVKLIKFVRCIVSSRILCFMGWSPDNYPANYADWNCSTDIVYRFSYLNRISIRGSGHLQCRLRAVFVAISAVVQASLGDDLYLMGQDIIVACMNRTYHATLKERGVPICAITGQQNMQQAAGHTYASSIHN